MFLNLVVILAERQGGTWAEAFKIETACNFQALSGKRKETNFR